MLPDHHSKRSVPSIITVLHHPPKVSCVLLVTTVQVTTLISLVPLRQQSALKVRTAQEGQDMHLYVQLGPMMTGLLASGHLWRKADRMRPAFHALLERMVEILSDKHV